MKPEKALEILSLAAYGKAVTFNKDFDDALKLSIEALLRIQVGRNNPGTHWNDLLPGED